MPAPLDAPSFPPGITLSKSGDGIELSPTLVDLLLTARENYDWPAGTGAGVSQAKIVDLEASVSGNLSNLSSGSAHQIVIKVSNWAGNKRNSHAKILEADPAQQAAMKAAIVNLINQVSAYRGIDALCSFRGISLVIASKIYRFCAPSLGAAVDRHASYFFNSLPITGVGFSTSFHREWSDGRHSSSRLPSYSASTLARNRKEYCNTYLPLLASMAQALNDDGHKYRCAASGVAKTWTPADVEMAAYYWWACNGAR